MYKPINKLMRKSLLLIASMFIAATSIAANTQPALRAPRPIRQQSSITKVIPNATNVIAPLAIGSDASDYTSITDWQSIGTGRYTDGFVA